MQLPQRQGTLSDNTVDKYVRTVQFLEGVDGFEKGNLKDTVKMMNSVFP